MKRKYLLFISIIAIVLCACTSPNTRAVVFFDYQADFERLKDFMLDERNVDGEYETYGIVYDIDGKISGIHGISQDLGKAELKSLNNLLNAFKTDFSFIGVGEGRVSFGGNGNDMFVYTVDDSIPKWFYSPNDRMRYTKEKLYNNWYHLYNNAR